MEEIYEFRIREKYAGQLFGPDKGTKLLTNKIFGDLAVRKIKISPTDPQFTQIGELNASIKKGGGDQFFFGWDIRRCYTAEEVERAELFLLWHVWTFEPAGEECGTRYDEGTACPHCKAGAQQISPLFLDWKRIPKKKDIARTIAGEIVVSRRLADLFGEQSITGAEFRTVRHFPASSAASKDWFQLFVKSCDAEVVPPTKTGVTPFDDDTAGKYRCPLGDLIGLARLSELWISRPSYTGMDIIASSQFIGTRRGLLRPERFLLISPKLRRVIQEQKLKGCEIEVAHLV